MNSDQKFTAVEKAFYSDGYLLGMKVVESGLSQNILFSSISEMYSAIDELINSVSTLAQKHNQSIHCKKGCEYCCHQPVFALEYEMQYLNSFIKERFSDKRQNEIGEKADENRFNLIDLDKTQILNSKQPCPLLKNGTCSAYEARPMACRIYLSTDVNSCITFYDKPKDKSSFPALLDFPMRAGRMMNEGFKAALKTKVLVMKEFRIDEKIKLPPH